MGGSTRRWWLPKLVVVLALAAHLFTVVSVARQPWSVSSLPSERSFVWPLFHDAVHRLGPAADFFALYHAGVKAGKGENPYEISEVPRITPYFYPYRYGPGVAVTLGRALAALSPRTAYVVWVVVMEGVLALFLVALWRWQARGNAAGPGRVFLLLAATVACLSTPFFLEVHMGQFTFVTMALLGIALLSFDGPEVPNGWQTAIGALAFAAATELKIVPWVAAPALLRARRGVWALVAAIGLFLVLDVSAFSRSPGLFSQFLSLNFDTGFVGLDPGNHGLLYVFFLSASRWGVHWTAELWHATALSWEAALLGSSALAVLIARVRPALGGATLALAHMLSYVQVWEHHYSGALVMGLVLLGGLLATEAPLSSARTRQLAGVALGCLIAMALPTTFYLQDRAKIPLAPAEVGWTPIEFALPPLCKVLPALILYGLGMLVVARSGFVVPFLHRHAGARELRSRSEA